MSICHKINNVDCRHFQKNVFQRRAVEVFLVNVLKVRTSHKYGLRCEWWNITANACVVALQR